jgi:hypothetical protein
MLIYLRDIKRIASMTFILNKGKEIENLIINNLYLSLGGMRNNRI